MWTGKARRAQFEGLSTERRPDNGENGHWLHVKLRSDYNSSVQTLSWLSVPPRQLASHAEEEAGGSRPASSTGRAKEDPPRRCLSLSLRMRRICVLESAWHSRPLLS
eukprot:scaffold104115_cov67-Phaeocystis_antarctica.AAC.2